jgi:hypothetical protein
VSRAGIARRTTTTAPRRFSDRERSGFSLSTVYPDLDGYFVVADWEGGGRAAARVKTHRRRKVYPVPEEILGMFSGEEMAGAVRGSMATRPGTSYEATVNRLASIPLEFTSSS